ncbi:ORF6N domain-containing protein [Agriterribacter sp.]|uniref:ORF6N domain-containing protein n=1 Tax=Agriterribacter sp. TaxID=2821509 RepID=UPI002D1C2953|nr:ORF6N domain-containing protein [Agriterribacter sp.]HRP56807.1 ORF6N domain-containing protein [Agriterribacter sp.]
MKTPGSIAVTDNDIVQKIYVVRGSKVMLDKDLAEMYGVPTSRLNEAVKRNILRFPEDFMFQLTENEFKNLISQNAISSWGGTRKMPRAFTEHGVAMLSSVLRSEQAIQVNIRIVRVYTRMRQLILDNKDLWMKMEKIEQALAKKDEEVQAIFKVLKNLLVGEEKPRQPIGFKIPGNK